MKKIIIMIFLVLALCGCNSKQGIKTDSNQELREIILENNYIVVDVRTKEEYDLSHVKDSVNIPYDKIDEKIKLDNTKTILVYCASGNRSNMAYESLISLGYDVYDLGAYENITLPKE